MPLEGKKALVTGAASGIGSSIVSRFRAEGVQVFATDIHQTGDLIVADLTDADDIEKLAAQVGTPDFLVNVAGGPVAPSRSKTLPALPTKNLVLEDIDELQWAAVIAANLTSAFLVCRQFAPRMKARRSGRIVNFASIAARRGSDRVGVHYAAAKGGIIALTKTLALELGPFGITVNAIAPGFIRTPRIAEANWGNATREFIDSLPLKRAGRPEDIAGVVAMLCSEAGGYVSGATIDVNGGLYFGP
jgi:3-oxoacyl-[acyl-carrier protein] reductase